MTFECQACGPLLDVDLNDDPVLRKDNWCRRHTWHTIKCKNFSISVYPRYNGVREITTYCGYCNEPIFGKLLDNPPYRTTKYYRTGYANLESPSPSYGTKPRRWKLRFSRKYPRHGKRIIMVKDGHNTYEETAKIPIEEIWACILTNSNSMDDNCGFSSIYDTISGKKDPHYIHFKGSTFQTAESLVCSECLANEGKNSSNRKRPPNPQEHHTPHYDDDEDYDDEDEGVNNNSGGRRRFGPGYS